MPVKVKKPDRGGCKPFVYFKGKKEGLQEVNTETLMKAFDEADPRLFKGLDVQQSRLEKLRTDILARVEDLERGNKKSCLIPVKTSLGDVILKMTLRPNGSVLIHQQPATHGLMEGRFDILKEILERGFTGHEGPNVTIDTKRRRLSWAEGDPAGWEMTNMDRYGLELMTPMSEAGYAGITGFIQHSSPKQVVCVNIEFSRRLTDEQIEARKEFYKRELKEFGIPIHFVKPKT